MVVWVSIVYPCEHAADWGLWFTVTAQRLERKSYHVLLEQEKIQIQNLKYGLYYMHMAFSLLKSQKVKSQSTLS